jgi:Cdc6-like AAA superfamily ATPase
VIILYLNRNIELIHLRRTIELMRPMGRAARTNDVKDVIKEMQNSPTAAYLRECSLHERIMLASFIKCMRRDGIEEIKVGDVCDFPLGLLFFSNLKKTK